MCTDEAGLSDADKLTRKSLGYRDRAADPSLACEKCHQYLEAPSAEACGSCKLVKGPVSRAGSCRLFSART